MYTPASFAEHRLPVLHDFLRQYPFATLVSTAADGQSSVSHLPLLLDKTRGQFGTLIGHFARVNSHTSELVGEGRQALAIFHGPHAYVSPTWYQTAPAVPTWNYAVVHARGLVKVITDEAAVREILDQTVKAFEAPGSPWRMSDLPEPFTKSMTAGVVAFEIEIVSLEGKFKLSQNRSVKDQAGVVAALSGGSPEEQATAKLMQTIHRR